MSAYRQVRDSELSAEVLTERGRRRRIYEINAQVATAVAHGTPLQTLLNHPAGLMGAGSEKGKYLSEEAEREFIATRYEALLRRYSQGKLDLPTYKRSLEDGTYCRWAISTGVLVEDTKG
jgi:hypothetical protein